MVVIFLILLCVLFHYRILMIPFGTTYKMIHDPMTKAYVQNYTGVKFPDSVKWEQCYFDAGWDGYTVFCAKLSISEKDIEALIPSDIDFEYFQDGLPVLSPKSSHIHSCLRKFDKMGYYVSSSCVKMV